MIKFKLFADSEFNEMMVWATYIWVDPRKIEAILDDGDGSDGCIILLDSGKVYELKPDALTVKDIITKALGE